MNDITFGATVVISWNGHCVGHSSDLDHVGKVDVDEGGALKKQERYALGRDPRLGDLEPDEPLRTGFPRRALAQLPHAPVRDGRAGHVQVSDVGTVLPDHLHYLHSLL